MNKVVLITGITGQDGAYLGDFLLKKIYVNHGHKRSSYLFNNYCIDHLDQESYLKARYFILHSKSSTDNMNLIRLTQEIHPEEIYNLAAICHAHISSEYPKFTTDADGF